LPEERQNAIAARLLAELPEWEDWISFVEEISGSMPDLPDRAPQGEYETRNTLE
jgi:hypothetical protein